MLNVVIGDPTGSNIFTLNIQLKRVRR